ncbi:MAG: hypothetical protein WA477_19045, partial [Candidatus Sulfotelmatobacter sp.]
ISGIFDLAENSEVIYGAQALTGKILDSKHLPLTRVMKLERSQPSIDLCGRKRQGKTTQGARVSSILGI